MAKACRCTAGIIRFVERLHAGNATMHPCKFRIVHGLAMFEARDACVIFWSDGIKRYTQRFITDRVDTWRESMSDDGARPRTEAIGMLRCKFNKHSTIGCIVRVRGNHARGAAAECAIDETLPASDGKEFVVCKGAAPREINRPCAIENGGNDAHGACCACVGSEIVVRIAKIGFVFHAANGGDSEGVAVLERGEQCGASVFNSRNRNARIDQAPRGLFKKQTGGSTRGIADDFTTGGTWLGADEREYGIVDNACMLIHAVGNARRVAGAAQPCARRSFAAPV